ncbi:Protein of unknown function [Lactobacillus helveticus CIRM-BIA 101]|nr:Protein of unknown function [Lactobacillus helveticus CIRM-BIA 101]
MNYTGTKVPGFWEH